MTPISLITSEEIDGEIRLNPAWAGLHSVARLDLLQDWLAVLTQLYQLTHHDTYGKGHDWQSNLIQAIKGWEHHGKDADDYKPMLLTVPPQGEA